mmetsp:Transcript_48040/g.35250  ORF Transcript_48040/g.35250 Transcript_48040/m.35250 type:complete len:195 (+) Transcript_48040:134-718(+)
MSWSEFSKDICIPQSLINESKQIIQNLRPISTKLRHKYRLGGDAISVDKLSEEGNGLSRYGLTPEKRDDRQYFTAGPVTVEKGHTLSKFAKDKTLEVDHHKLFTQIDNLLESSYLQQDSDIFNEEKRVVSSSKSTTAKKGNVREVLEERKMNMFKHLSKEYHNEAKNLSAIQGMAPVSNIFTKYERKKINPLDF